MFTFCVQHSLPAQDVNYRAIKKDTTKHLVSAGFGGDYIFYYHISYGHIFGSGFIPIVAGTEFSVPFGEDIADDWKWRTSVQAELWNFKSLSLSLKSSFILRRYESSLARMYNTGADVTLSFGYLKPGWGIIALANYDGSIATHIKHGLSGEFYPEIRDGWYDGAGGNFKFGARANLSLKSWNSFLTLGKHFGQNFNDNPTFPFFTEITIQRQLRK